jgi:hypothetical protein
MARLPVRASHFAAGLAVVGLGIGLALAAACASGDEGEGEGGASTTTATGAGGAGLTGGGGQGTTTTTTTTTTVSTGGSAPGEDDCLNGLDDDEDSFADCADTDCQGLGYECVPAFDSDVQYVGLFAVAPCPAGTDQIPLRSCDSCVCNEDPGTCNVSVELCDIACANCAAPLTEPVCRDVTNEARFVRGSFTPRNDDSCTVADGSVPPNEIVVCALPGPGSCPSGNHCVPPGYGNATARCVLLDGEGDCPGAYVAERVVFPEQANFCACDCVWGEQDCVASPTVISHDADDCTATTYSIDLDGECHDAQNVASIQIPEIEATVQCDRSAYPVGNNLTTRSLCCLP